MEKDDNFEFNIGSKDKGVKVTVGKHKGYGEKRLAYLDKIAGLITGMSLTLMLFVYVILGATVTWSISYSGQSSWALFSPLFLLGLVPGETFRAIIHRKPTMFPMYAIALFVFIFVGIYTGVWHPTWVAIVAIPAYYTFAGSMENLAKARREYLEDKGRDNAGRP